MRSIRLMAAVASLAIAATSVVSFQASAQSDNPIEKRQQLMKENGKAAKAAVQMIKGQAPYDPATAEKVFTSMHDVAMKFGDYFPPDQDRPQDRGRPGDLGQAGPVQGNTGEVPEGHRRSRRREAAGPRQLQAAVRHGRQKLQELPPGLPHREGLTASQPGTAAGVRGRFPSFRPPDVALQALRRADLPPLSPRAERRAPPPREGEPPFMLRRTLTGIVLLIVVCAVAFYLLTMPQRLDAATLPAAPSAKVGRGEELFWAGGCTSCHAAKDAKGDDKLKLGGGVPLKTDFGTFYPPNISPDPRTASAPGRSPTSPTPCSAASIPRATTSIRRFPTRPTPR